VAFGDVAFGVAFGDVAFGVAFATVAFGTVAFGVDFGDVAFLEAFFPDVFLAVVLAIFGLFFTPLTELFGAVFFAFSPFLGARVSATGHPLVCLALLY
jgi:hypothetical protein